jgi:threonine dehydrogenase-like Zn-dependent dehydrogenase
MVCAMRSTCGMIVSDLVSKRGPLPILKTQREDTHVHESSSNCSISSVGPLDVSGLITHRIGVDDYISGFEAMKSGNSGKVVMDW